MIDTIRKAWSWIGVNPAEIVYVNLFGNLIVKDIEGAFWRICPEELACDKIAEDSNAFAKIWSGRDFQSDWQMLKMVDLAEKKLGLLQKDECYCFKVPPVVGGSYAEANLAKISLKELVAFAGDFAEQIKDVPDGSRIEIKFVD
jgi:hypothetical protein